ncbi:BON domain-containing protein [Actinomarinicola tropica]|uniref:BON domain-containing protein n=1 Tax=Actinomarinicola tropica TaxID=2789776 RepID=A0A5Q2RLB1_9ACTN|nr:BON domain-containing protein [Actinomarinicola tropica]QGG94847.1 BON domain-containing protein [Actinomarinicola tropica]
MIRTLIALPFRLVALVVAIPTRLSARLLRFSVVTAARTTRLAVRSSLISFAVGVGLGWFLSTPTGRYATGVALDAVRGRRAPVDDAALAGRVRAALEGGPATSHLPQPQVAVAGGVVTLSGGVPDETTRTELLAAAATTEGVVSVVDRLVVGADPQGATV